MICVPIESLPTPEVEAAAQDALELHTVLCEHDRPLNERVALLDIYSAYSRELSRRVRLGI